ncbi:MAG TPA: hypothetical protein OIM03_03475 [Veillonellaceae bacterium]|nr:hypothetical protein [Veillonellaceae bacterium]
MRKYCRILTVLGVCAGLSFSQVNAADGIQGAKEHQVMKERALQMKAKEEEPSVRLEGGMTDRKRPLLPDEEEGFLIRHIVVKSGSPVRKRTQPSCLVKIQSSEDLP